jgi:hypothetical protein
MTATRKPFSLAFDLETTRPGEQVHAEPDPISDDCARRLRDVERAGKLRLQLVSAETGAWESARFCAFTQHDGPRAVAHGRAALFYSHLYRKICRLQARARGEASDG